MSKQNRSILFLHYCIFYLTIFRREKKIRRLTKSLTQLEIGFFTLKHFHIIDVKRASNNPLSVAWFPDLTHEENQGLGMLSNWLPVICVLMGELGQKSRFPAYKKMHFLPALQQTWLVPDFPRAVPMLDRLSLLPP